MVLSLKVQLCVECVIRRTLTDSHSHVAVHVSRQCLSVKLEVLGHHVQGQTGTPVRNGAVQLRVTALLLLIRFLYSNWIHLYNVKRCMETQLRCRKWASAHLRVVLPRDQADLRRFRQHVCGQLCD